MKEDILIHYKKATKLTEIDNAVRLDVPITPAHPFFIDFSDVRGDFEDRMIYKTLNVHPKTFFYNEINQFNKAILFLAGMRGSGKTSELSKITSNLHHANAFFCVICNLDSGLDINDMEYMDIVIFQIERLVEEVNKISLNVETGIIEDLYTWFEDRIQEINKAIKEENGFELEVKGGTPSLLSFLGFTAKLKTNLAGTKENAEKIRKTFRNNFTAFAQKFNTFIENINILLRENKVAKEILFVVDGLEKIATLDIRKKIVVEEGQRIRQIKANTIFTLPIELASAGRSLSDFSTVVSFPFVKIQERNGDEVRIAIERFETFIYKRIDQSLFESDKVVKKAIQYGGGSPRELLRVLQYANMYADEDTNKITMTDLDKGIKKLAAETAQYVSPKDFEKLKLLKDANKAGKQIATDDEWQSLLEKLIILEYNDGTYKRVNPVVEASQLYKQYVG